MAECRECRHRPSLDDGLCLTCTLTAATGVQSVCPGHATAVATRVMHLHAAADLVLARSPARPEVSLDVAIVRYIAAAECLAGVEGRAYGFERDPELRDEDREWLMDVLGHSPRLTEQGK